MPNIKRFIVLGDAGAGKSTFINAMYNYCYGTRMADEVFQLKEQSSVKLSIPSQGWSDLVASNAPSSERDITDQTESQTATCNTYSLECEEGSTFELIDTPGFNDTEGTSRDECNLEEIEKALRGVPFLSGMIIIANGALVRLGTSFQHFLRLLHEIWPNSLTNNVCVVLTNCDEVSCNLDSVILRQSLHVNDNTIFRMQNNLFRWDRKTYSGKAIRHFRQNFEDTIATIGNLFLRLSEFADVSTEDFNVGQMQQALIDKSIQEILEAMISLIGADQDQQTAQQAILYGHNTMQANQQWEKKHEINAIKWVETPIDVTSNAFDASTKSSAAGQLVSAVTDLPRKGLNTVKSLFRKTTCQSATDPKLTRRVPKRSASCGAYPSSILDTKMKTNSNPTYKAKEVKVQLTLPDNAAISHHQNARAQVSLLDKQVMELTNTQEALRGELNSLLDQLATHVQRMRQINRNVDLLQKHDTLLSKFAERVNVRGGALDMKSYWKKTVAILSKPSSDDCRATTSEPMETDC